jgi:hypothetical protein
MMKEMEQWGAAGRYTAVTFLGGRAAHLYRVSEARTGRVIVITLYPSLKHEANSHPCHTFY